MRAGHLFPADAALVLALLSGGCSSSMNFDEDAGIPVERRDLEGSGDLPGGDDLSVPPPGRHGPGA